MIKHVVAVDSKRVCVHPRLIGDLGVDIEVDLSVSIVGELAKQGRWVGVCWNHDIGVGQRVITVEGDGVFGNHFDGEENEIIDVNPRARELIIGYL